MFLTLPDNHWPITLQENSGRGDAMKGLKPESKSKISVTSTNEATNTNMSMKNCISLEKFSDCQKLF